MLDTVTLPKKPAPVTTYVLGWSPDHDARQWMKGQTPLWLPYAPMDVLAEEFAITPQEIQNFAGRIIADSVKRFGYCELKDAKSQPCARPDWPFTWPDPTTGLPTAQWRLAPQETTLAHVAWAIKHGYPAEGFNVLALQFLAYQLHGWWDPADKKNPAKWYDPKFAMTPSEWSELRNFGNAAQNYGTAGRHRHARGCVDYAANSLDVLHFFGVKDGPQHEYLELKLAAHVGNINAKFPLVDDPKGDHFGPTTPFVSAYQTSALRHVLALAAEVSTVSATRATCSALASRIDNLLIEFGPCAMSDPTIPMSAWWYDIPFENGQPRKVVTNEQGAQINYGIAGVASYHVAMLQKASDPIAPTLLAALRDDATSKKWPTLHPVETAWAFGTTAI